MSQVSNDETTGHDEVNNIQLQECGDNNAMNGLALSCSQATSTTVTSVIINERDQV